MARQSRFYLARVNKRGALTSQRVVEAFIEPMIISLRGSRYSFTDFREIRLNGNVGYYARIAKYREEGAVTVLQEAKHVSVEASIPNLIEASSPFVYIPAFGGLAYRHMWNVFPRELFERLFSALVEQKYLLAGCDVTPVVDLRTFVMRLSKLDVITELSATVTPPNPLFGPCWKSLSEYLRKRDLQKMTVKEQSDSGIDTRLKELAARVLELGESEAQIKELMETLLDGVGDAALLMAADGYGRGRVTGREGDHFTVIRTSENQKSFALEVDPDPHVLFERAYYAFIQISDERGLQHP